MSTKIEWTNETWNPVTGCTKVSPGCKNCYAERQANRLQRIGQPNYANGFQVTLQPHMLDKPNRWRKPRTVFVCSMADLFHEDVPIAFLRQVFDVMGQNPRHTFQVLTKRAERMFEFVEIYEEYPNVWLGVSVEDQRRAVERLPLLRQTPATIRFLSVEPLLGPIDFSALPDSYVWAGLSHIDWVICGGESGPGARPMHPEWARSIRDQCLEQKVPFFFKQWGGVHKSENRELDGREWNEMPIVKQPGYLF